MCCSLFVVCCSLFGVCCLTCVVFVCLLLVTFDCGSLFAVAVSCVLLFRIICSLWTGFVVV